MAYINAETDAESVIETMNGDAEFAAELWFEIAEKLNMGLLLDNACDIFEDEPEKAKYIASQFENFAEALRSRHADD